MQGYSLQQLRQALDQRQFSAGELAEYYLKRAEEHQKLNALISLNTESLMQAAQIADQSIASGKSRALTGIPILHKDNFCTNSLPTTAGSRFLADYRSPFQATIVERLEEQGALLLAKSNMDEFGMGSSNENSYFGPVRNPWNQEHVPGGSSGGSAAALAADLAVLATGSDTGGSIRLPAAYCGISGIKPSYGLVSRYGLIAYASSLDQAGPMARRVEDLALALEIMAGFDPKDSTSLQQEIPDYQQAIKQPLAPIKIGLCRRWLEDSRSADLQASMQEAIQSLEKQGAQCIDIDFSLEKYWVACYYLIACAEASSNLARYDGIRFGRQAEAFEDLQSLIQNSRDQGFGLEVKRRILAGSYLLSAGYYEAYYLQAQKVRRLIQAEMQRCFQQVDLILSPTAAGPAPALASLSNPLEAYQTDRYTVVANLAGLPALSLPIGFSQGLPLGMQLMGPYFSESILLQWGAAYQRQTDWHLRSVENS